MTELSPLPMDMPWNETKADPIPEPEKVEVAPLPDEKDEPEEQAPKAKKKAPRQAKGKTTGKKAPAKKAPAKKKAKPKILNVKGKQSVAKSTDTGLGPKFKDEAGNIIPIWEKIDEAYVKKIINESVNVSVPEGVAGTQILPQYVCYTRLFDIFNALFFGNELEPVMLVFQEQRGVAGMFKFKSLEIKDEKSGKKMMVNRGVWQNGEQGLSEISLNPKVHFTEFAEGKGMDAISTLVHEMVHHWEFSSAVASDNKVPRDNYHGKIFAEKMESLGLITTNNGKEGGARTGRTMTHYVDKNGPFAQLFKMLPEELLWPIKGPKANKEKGFVLPPPIKPKNHRSRNKVKYECPHIHKVSEKGDRECDVTIWSKPDREGQLACMNHGEPVKLVAVNNPE